jgi:crotonobetainyl-CoA:carnitine CoA-transferase CaiB-like acyl-CoA transferase
VAAVPMTARHLADFGADVVHVEHPLRGDSWRVFQTGQGTGTYGASSEINYNWENFNRNKRSLTLDLSREGGREVIYKMLPQADVFVTNLRPFERERFGVEYDTVHQLNPRLIYGSLTGFGQKGPDRNNPSYDTVAYWARSGIPHRISWPGVSLPGYSAAMGDNVAALALAYGIVTSLYVRNKTGVGQEVDVSLYHIGIYQISCDIAGALVTGQDCDEWKYPSREDVLNPLSNVYETKDGRSIQFVMLQPDRWWARVCQALGRDDLIDDPRFATFEARRENHVILNRTFAEAMMSKTLDEWKPRLEGIPYAPFQNYIEVINDPQAWANEFFVPVDHPTYGQMNVVSSPIKLSETPAMMRMTAPEVGQHTEEVLLEYGYTWEDIAQLKEQGIIA